VDHIDEARREQLLPRRDEERVLEIGPEIDQDFTALRHGDGEFDVAVSLWTVRRMRRPELLIAELARVTKPGGRILVVDRIAPVDPLAALDLNRAAREEDPTVTRVLAEGDFRALFDANSLKLRREEVVDDVGWFVLTR